MAGTIHELDDLNVVRQIKQNAVNAIPNSLYGLQSLKKATLLL